MTCRTCNQQPKKHGCNPPNALTIVNPEQPILFHRVDYPASMGDDTTNPPESLQYRNVLLVYQANGHAYLFSSDGIPTRLDTDISSLERKLKDLGIKLDNETADREAADAELSDRIETGLAEEAEARQTQDDALFDELDNRSIALEAEIEQLDTKLEGVKGALETETEDRQAADVNLQEQIDALADRSDVVDVVGTHEELETYDTSKLGDNDIVKVLSDETHDGAITYYRWSKTSGEWLYVGETGPYYTKSEVDEQFNEQGMTAAEKAKLSNLLPLYSLGTGLELVGNTLNATASAKLYSAYGTNTDGALTQKFVSDKLNGENILLGSGVTKPVTGLENDDQTVVIGYRATSANRQASTTGWSYIQRSVVLGANAFASAYRNNYSVAIGSSATTSSTSTTNPNYAIAIGSSASNSGNAAVAIGALTDISSSSSAYSVALGYESRVKRAYEVSIGNPYKSENWSTRYLTGLKPGELDNDATTVAQVRDMISEAISGGGGGGGGATTYHFTFDEYEAFYGDPAKQNQPYFWEFLQEKGIPPSTDLEIVFTPTKTSQTLLQIHLHMYEDEIDEWYNPEWLNFSAYNNHEVVLRFEADSTDSNTSYYANYYLQNNDMIYKLGQWSTQRYRIPDYPYTEWSDSGTSLDRSHVLAASALASTKQVMGLITDIEGLGKLDPYFQYYSTETRDYVRVNIVTLKKYSWGMGSNWQGEFEVYSDPDDLMHNLKNGWTFVYILDENNLPAGGDLKSVKYRGDLTIYLNADHTESVKVGVNAYNTQTSGHGNFEEANTSGLITGVTQTDQIAQFRTDGITYFTNFDGKWYFSNSSQSVYFSKRTLAGGGGSDVNLLDAYNSVPADTDVYSAKYVNSRLDSDTLKLGTVGKGTSVVSGGLDSSIIIGKDAIENASSLTPNRGLGTTNAVVIGNSASATSSITAGNSSRDIISNAVAIGESARASWTTAGTSSYYNRSVAIGPSALATGTDSDHSVAVGYRAQATKWLTTVIGASSSAASVAATAVGDHASCLSSASYSAAFGYMSKASRESEVSIGDGSTSNNYGTRYLANVRAGTLDTDAVNVAQLNAAVGNINTLLETLISGEGAK